MDVFVIEVEVSYKIIYKIKFNVFIGMGWVVDNFFDLLKVEIIDIVGVGFCYFIDEYYGIIIGLDVVYGLE